MEAFAPAVEEEGVVRRSAELGRLSVGELSFPPRYVQPPFEPEEPYLAVVVAGALEKSFGRDWTLGPGAALTMPAGAVHGASFGPVGARIVIVKGRLAVGRLEILGGTGFALLARRLAVELRAADAGAPLAAEGLALELLAAAARDTCVLRRASAWLDQAEELLRVRRGDCIRLSELARELGVPPVQVARAFRKRHGISVGEFGRRLRVEWAAEQLAADDRPIAEIAAEAGFADQSHFTRVFRRHLGTTPALYRAFQRT